MNVDIGKSAILGYYEDICAKDPKALSARWTDDGTFANPVGVNRFLGAESIEEFLTPRLANLDTVRIDVPWCVVCGDQGAAHWTAEVLGINGNRVALQGVTIFTFAPDGRFAVVDEYFDSAEFPGATAAQPR